MQIKYKSHRQVLFGHSIVATYTMLIQSFLTNCTQRVVINDTYSSPCDVTSGVPQESMLGPILFLIYVNNITSNIHSQLRLYADNCLVYHPINSPDHKTFQDDLYKLLVWADIWYMRFSVKKCCILHVSTLHTLLVISYYTMHSIPLQVVEQHHYLGVLIDNKLSWTPHKANRLLGFLCRNLHHCPPHLKEHAYKLIVLPSIEYCSTIWDPYEQTSIHKLGMIQHRAARFVLNKPWRKTHRDSITDLLQSLDWPSLEKHRRHLCLILLFKFLNRSIHIPTQYLPASFPLNITKTNHNQKLMQLYARTNRYHYPFLPRTILDWNNLCIGDLANCNLDSFKFSSS